MLHRDDALEVLAKEKFDVLVVGGGATGAGVALDAVTRGYSVALVEKSDYAAGTSSRSSKLIHGGLRYLQHFDLGLVREALLERELLANLAPHIVRPLPLLVPAFGGTRPDRLVGLGLNMYDVMAVRPFRRPALWGSSKRARGSNESEGAGEHNVMAMADWSPARHRLISGAEVSELIPALAERNPTGGYLFYDCQTDDVRLVLTILAEAARFGAVCANGLEVESLIETDGRAVGAHVRDRYSSSEFEIQAKNVVNATGVWADRLRPGELRDEADVPVIRPSRGTHIIVSGKRLPMVAGAIAPASSNRTIFILPWLGSTLIGTTDEDYQGDLDHVPPSEDDIEYLLNATNEFFGSDLTTADIDGAFAGVRPLISSSDNKKSVDISRKAELYETSSGMITITGGKLTTWRRMAKMTVDRIVERDGGEAPCRTHRIPLGVPVDPTRLPRLPTQVSENVYTHLANRYGQSAHEVIALAVENPALAQPILPDHPDILAEAAYAVQREQAQTIADVLLRRTRLAILAAREVCARENDVVPRLARVLGDELSWNRRRRKKEIQAWHDYAKAEGVVVDGAK